MRMRDTFLKPMHPEGRKFVAIFTVVSLVLFLIWEPLGWIGVGLTVWCYYFFRDPDRVTPTRPGLVHIQSVPFIRGAQDISTGDLTPETVDQVLDASFEKYFHMASLMGSFEKCLDTVDEIDAIGVTEIACLVDFGVAPDIAMAALENLNVVRVLANPKPLAPARAAARADANHPAAQRRSA